MKELIKQTKSKSKADGDLSTDGKNLEFTIDWANVFKEDHVAGVVQYEYAVGTAPLGANIRPLTKIGKDKTSVAIPKFTMVPRQRYGAMEKEQ